MTRRGIRHRGMVNLNLEWRFRFVFNVIRLLMELHIHNSQIASAFVFLIWTVYFESGVSPFLKKSKYHVIYA